MASWYCKIFYQNKLSVKHWSVPEWLSYFLVHSCKTTKIKYFYNWFYTGSIFLQTKTKSQIALMSLDLFVIISMFCHFNFILDIGNKNCEMKNFKKLKLKWEANFLLTLVTKFNLTQDLLHQNHLYFGDRNSNIGLGKCWLLMDWKGYCWLIIGI